MTARMAVVAVVLVAATASLSGQSAPASFRRERAVVTSGAGHYRLAVDAPLLAGAAPFDVEPRPGPAPGESSVIAVGGGLSDLRLFDGAGHEVPYLLVPPADPKPTWVPAKILPTPPAKKTSGFEMDLGSAATVDRLRVEGLPAPFLKRCQLEASGDRERWTTTAGEATLFDLPDERLRQVELPFAPGDYRYLRVTWDDTNSGRVPLPRGAAARRIATRAAAAPTTAAVSIEPRPSEPKRSRYRVHLPGPHLPVTALVLDVTGDHVLREAVVSESRLAGFEAAPAVLGRATLRRVVVGSAAASDLRVPIATPAEADLDLAIDDGDNPPLTLNGATVEFAELPWIYFESDGSPIVARFGGALRARPRYDLEAVRNSLDIDTARTATWGAATSLPAAAETAPAPLPLEGAPIDVQLFRHVRAVPAGNPGLVALPLDASVLAQSAGPSSGFADVRVVTADGHQVPYLVERRDEPLSVDIPLTPATAPRDTAGGGRSAYWIHLPYASLPASQLVLTTDARVFDRSLTVAVEEPADRFHRDRWTRTLATARWVHADRDLATPALGLPIPATAATDLVLLVDEGDNRALPLGPARLLLPSYRLRFYRGAGAALTLAFGRDDLAAPRYDLALLAPQVLGVAATEVSAAADTVRPPARSTAIASPAVFWTVIVLAAVILLGFVVRLLARS